MNSRITKRDHELLISALRSHASALHESLPQTTEDLPTISRLIGEIAQTDTLLAKLSNKDANGART